MTQIPKPPKLPGVGAPWQDKNPSRSKRTHSKKINGHVFGLGVDPGLKNCGIAIVKRIEGSHRVEPLYATTIDPSKYPCMEEFIDGEIFDKYVKMTEDHSISRIRYVTIERYVAYAGVKAANTEAIQSMIGMINMASWRFVKTSIFDHDKFNVRAIEWKVKLAQTLAKHVGFKNPSQDLDKKFSIAAAKELIGPDYEITSDHTADAICIATLPFLQDLYQDFDLPGRGAQGTKRQAELRRFYANPNTPPERKRDLDSAGRLRLFDDKS